jgi:hypothetical protein
MNEPPANDDSAPKKAAENASAKGAEANPAASAEPMAPAQLTKEEQWALFEKELKENDWGHQPC